MFVVDSSWGGHEAQQALIWLRKVHRPSGTLAVDADGRPLADGSRCVICGGVIDYQLRYPHPDSLSLQHTKPRTLYPELKRNRAYWAPAHLHCNSALGDKEEVPGGEFPDTYW